jgi:hypothetical protein
MKRIRPVSHLTIDPQLQALLDDPSLKIVTFRLWTYARRQTRGGAVVALRPRPNDPELYDVGVSICSPADEFDRNVGRLRAVGRLGRGRDGSLTCRRPEGLNLTQLARRCVVEAARRMKLQWGERLIDEVLFPETLHTDDFETRRAHLTKLKELREECAETPVEFV